MTNNLLFDIRNQIQTVAIMVWTMLGVKQLVKQSVPGFRPEKLSEARIARGLNQTNLSKLAGVSRQQISKYEKGEQAPTSNNFDVLCDVLNVPADYLLRERKRSIDRESPLFYRSNASALQMQRDSAEAQYVWFQDTCDYLLKFVDFPDLNFPDIQPPSDPTKLYPEDIESAAEELRKLWGMADSPISNVVRLVENNGIIVTSYDLGSNELDAFSNRQFHQPFIVLGRDRGSACRIRFSIAHELGHLLLHKNVPPFAQQSKEIFRLMENQAHRFAGAFLFPYDAFLGEVTRPSLEVFRVLKARWKMSIQAMICRSIDLEMLDKDDSRRMHISMNRRGWKKRAVSGCPPSEILDDQIDIEQPELIRDAFDIAVEEVPEKAQIVSGIGLSQSDIEEVSNLPKGYLSETVVNLDTRRIQLKNNSESVSTPKSTKKAEVIPFVARS